LAKAFSASEERIGEAWLVADESIVANGEFAGLSLREALSRVDPNFWGDCPVATSFPLLVKLLDTSDWLSVQVHPDDDFVARYELNTGYTGKDEVWIVMEAGPDARVVYGFARDLDRAELEDAINNDRLWPLLNVVSVEAGDVIYVPAGTVHALGPDLLVLEVSQRSDLTYRLYDFGRGRTLDLKKGLDVAKMSKSDLQPLKMHEEFNLQTRNFNIVTIGKIPFSSSSPFVITKYSEISRAELFSAGEVQVKGHRQRLAAIPNCVER